MDIYAEITGIEYEPLLCSDLESFYYEELGAALSNETAFMLRADSNAQLALSWWVSPKRTRSYPYPRVYNTLGFAGKRVTIIPVIKDEGQRGDRDFLQWDTISLMSLLCVNVIISYYVDASRSTRYADKITDQKFDIEHVTGKVDRLMSYQSSALHWNMNQVENIGEVGLQALNAYSAISERLGVQMHSRTSAERRIDQLRSGHEEFRNLSRALAQQAQHRETITVQPKERVTGIKGKLTIKNYLGGYYYLTCDEVEIHGDEIHLIEAKHTRSARLPSHEDIKDGLLKMILFTNLKHLKVGDKDYTPVPILKLTTGAGFNLNSLSHSQRALLTDLEQEARTNGFQVTIKGESL
ncbi:hypothetical protein F4X33_08760 [Candidatus Poribacteria bacterium]|nr:hypothetical protein [Candidatus Poribacteria bacterium]